jgi:hypothetical protein
MREDYFILGCVFGIVGEGFIPCYSWSKPVISYLCAFTSLSQLTCTQKYPFLATYGLFITQDIIHTSLNG